MKRSTGSSPGSLSAYRTKRNFRATPEPRGKRARSGGTRAALAFVIQKHHARNLHYDFRLELDGALKSWAVPKGPSLDPAEKRLAVHVEDHPLEYAAFEGEIPEKQYGAGQVIVWDRGTWRPDVDPHEGYRAGKLKFHLDGAKLHGGWALVRTRMQGPKEQWLLIKERDQEARPSGEFDVTRALPDSVLSRSSERGAKIAPEPVSRNREASSGARSTRKSSSNSPAKLTNARKAALPAQLKPQLATLVDTFPRSGDWIYEIKFDGYRILARIDRGAVRLITRNGLDWTSRMQPLATALAELGLKSAWLDGEIVVLDRAGVPDFQALQNAFDAARTADIRYFLFDLPYCDGYDLTQAPQRERRALLESILRGARSPLLRYSEAFADAPERVLESACRMSLEGIVGKLADAPYVSARTRAWIKLKCRQRQEFVIGGYTGARGSRSHFGSLLLGVNEEGGLRYAGKVGTGFDERTLQALHEKLQALEQDASPYAAALPAADRRGVHWVRPQLVAEVAFAQWTGDGMVRQAVFQGLRADKGARQVQRERPQAPPGAGGRSAKAQARRETEIAGIRITHPDRVIDSASGLTKLDLAHYYHAVAGRMLPHLADRPVALLRAPEGIDGQLFFQKHLGRGVIDEARQLPPACDPGHPPLLVLETQNALVGAAQMGVVELHTWNTRARHMEQPDRFVLDLDPDPSLPWARVIEAAELTRGLLDELKLKCFLKTTGGRGLHVVVPLLPKLSWEEVKDFSAAIAQHLARTLPDRFSAKMGPQNRVHKVFVDYLRNSRGASSVAAYSVRARPGLPVSVPIAWEELVELESGQQWTVRNLAQRLADTPRDPWAGYERSRQSIARAVATLAR